MTVLIAPNAFKGSLGAAQVAAILAAGLGRRRLGARFDLMPISDGGDGLMEVLLARRGGRRVSLRVLDALGRPCRAAYALLEGGKTAVVEMASASGIWRVPPRLLDPLGATSYGTGQLIADAVARGSRRILVGLGGSATNDGGAGMAAALGGRLLDAAGRDLPRGAAPLARLARVEGSRPRALLRGVRVFGISDVSNPLLGPRGSARVYGPQKGASPAQVLRLESALTRYAAVLERDLGAQVARLPGAGAAGGLGAGLVAWLRAELVPGAAWVLRELGAEARLRRARLVLTGEGRLDRQSFFGKAPLELAKRARRLGVPVWLVCGRVAPEAEPALRRLGCRWWSLSPAGEPPSRSRAAARRRLEAWTEAFSELEP